MIAAPVTPAIPKSIARQMTGIQWADFTGNPWIGCAEVPANTGGRSGCEICYAAQFATNRMGKEWGPGAERSPVASFVSRMRRLDKLAATTGMPFSVFSLSLGDWLDAEVPVALRDTLFDTVEECRNLNWLLLTHRPHLARKLAPASWRTTPPVNVWPGVTVDHPAHARRWHQHADFWGHTGRAWISAEPLAASLAGCDLEGFATMIMGGASGTDDPSWEFDPDWVAPAVDRWGADRIFFKQFGDWFRGKRIGKKAAGRIIDGKTYDRTPWPRHRDALEAAAQRTAKAGD